MSGNLSGYYMELHYLKLNVANLNKILEDLWQLKIKNQYVEKTLTEKGLLIDNQMPFQFHIDQLNLDINDCEIIIEEEITKTNSKITNVEHKIEEDKIMTAVSNSSKASPKPGKVSNIYTFKSSPEPGKVLDIDTVSEKANIP